MAYYDLSTQLFQQQNFNGDNKVGFFCGPQIILDDQAIQNIFELVRQGITDAGGLPNFIKRISRSKDEHQYLFLLSLLLCIPPEERVTNLEKGYWGAFEGNLRYNPTQQQRSNILTMLTLFCRNHKIPFFDIYQNNRQTNIVGRIYSLLPFTENELYALCFMVRKVGTVGYNDFSTLSEIALSGYEDIFHTTTIGVLENLNDQIKICNTDFDYVPVDNWCEYFQSYFDRFSNNLEKLTIPDDKSKKLEDTLSESGNSYFYLPDHLTFYFQSDQNNHIGRFLIQSKKSSIEIVNNRIPERIRRLSIQVNIEGRMEKKSMEIGKFLVTSHPENSTWKEIQISKNRRVAWQEIIGYIEVIDCALLIGNEMDEDQIQKFLKFNRLPNSDIPIEVIRKYKSIDYGVFIEMTGGLTAGRGVYFWFGLPKMTVHNAAQDEIVIRLDGNTINTQDACLNDRFNSYIKNRIRDDQKFLAGNETYNLDFIYRDQSLRSSLQIQGTKTNLEILPRINQSNEATCPIGTRSCNDAIMTTDYAGLELIENDEHLLHWISSYGNNGVEYDHFQRAVNETHGKNYNNGFNIGSRSELVKLTKIFLEQYIGLGYIETFLFNGRKIRYRANPACFLCTHDGFLLLSGGRSWYETKKLLDQVSPKISNSVKMYDVGLPRIIKIDPEAAIIKIKLDRSDVCIANYGFKGFQVVRGGLGNRVSYPLSTLNNFSILELENTILGPGENLLSGNNRYLRYDPTTLNYVEINNIQDFHQFDVFKPLQSYKPVLYVFQRMERGDDGQRIFANEVVLGKHHEAIYFSLVKRNNGNRTNLGWIYDRANHKLYIPRRANVPDQIRHTLQSAVGAYTNVKFALRDEANQQVLLPVIGEEGISWCNQQRNAYELEEFSCIPNSFIAPLEEKLSITINRLPL
jgi:hypothetical protein